MQFRLGQIESLTFTPNAKKDPTASLKLSAELTPDLAEKMRCKEAVFRPDGKPHPNVTRLDLGGATLRDIDLSLPSGAVEGAFDTYRPEDISSFRVEVDGMLARLYMLARIKGRYLELVDFLEKQNTENFELAVRSAQQEFDWSGKGGTGTSVDMGTAGKKEGQGPLFGDHRTTVTTTEPDGTETTVAVINEAPCVHCDMETPRNCEATTHSSTATEGEKQETRGPVLPAIHETMSGRRGRRLTRGEQAEADRAKNEHPELRGDIAAEHHPADGEPVFPVN
jgi:hypothetical protein